VLAVAVGLLALDHISRFPSSDSGGYENMLRYFLATGRVDYMRWSQPTFVGMLPAAMLWSRGFGIGSYSLALLTSLHALLLLVGVMVFASESRPPWVAALLGLFLAGCPTFFREGTRFMTDIPFCCYLVWFLVLHRRLEREDAGARAPGGDLPLWIGYTLLLLLTALVRSFALILLPALLVQAGMARGAAAPFARRAAVAALVAAVLFVGIVKLSTRNGFSLVELTILKPLLVQHEFARFDLHAMALAWFETGFALSPALLLLPGGLGSGPKRRIGWIAAGVGLLAIGLRFWIRSQLPARFYPIWLPSTEHTFALLTVALGTVGIVGAFVVLRRALGVGRRSTTELLVVIVVTHFLILPIMNHPLTRHVFPGFVALLLLVATAGSGARATRAARPASRPEASRMGLLLAGLAGLLLAGFNLVEVAAEREGGAVQWRLARGLVDSGTPPGQIDAGWGWFCKMDLVPGTEHPGDYVAAYKALVESARYQVGDVRALAGGLRSGGRLLREAATSGVGPPQTIGILDRGQGAGGE
jgi:hypothetical protein